MNKVISYIAGIIFLCYISYDYGNTKSNIAFKDYKLKQQIVINNLSKEYQDKINLNNKEKEREISTINQRHSIIVASLQQRPQRNNDSLSNNTSTISPRAGSTGEQLFREDAEFLIGEATKSEILKQSLINCRKQFNEAVPNSK